MNFAFPRLAKLAFALALARLVFAQPYPIPPVLTPTPGAGVSADPSVVDKLALNDHLFLREKAKYDAIVNFLNAVRDWKVNSQQRVANGLPLDPEPVAPAGYVLAPDPPAPPAPAPSFTPVVRPLTQYGQYPAPGDNNPAGTVIANPYLLPGHFLVKVIVPTPFGNAHWWEPQ